MGLGDLTYAVIGTLPTALEQESRTMWSDLYLLQAWDDQHWLQNTCRREQVSLHRARSMPKLPAPCCASEQGVAITTRNLASRHSCCSMMSPFGVGKPTCGTTSVGAFDDVVEVVYTCRL